MGVSGSGKSTIGSALADALGLPFVEGDDLHPEANRRKMAAGRPLTDEDRGPWLDAVAETLASGPVVVSCSALKRAYRDRLREADPEFVLLFLHGTRELLTTRIRARTHEFMPTTLLDSQLATLEEPGMDEQTLSFDIELRPEEIVELAVHRLEDR